MRRLRDWPIRRKVALLIGVTSVVGLLFAGAAVVAYELTTFRPRALRDARTQAELIAINTIAALQFDDPQAATENLATLSNRSEIHSARVWEPNGRLFASYVRPGVDAPPPPRLVAGTEFLPDRLVLTEPLEDQGQQVGWLTLQYAIAPLWQRLPQYGIMVVVVAVALATAGGLLLEMLGRSVSRPLRTLTDAADTISRTGSYGLRVERLGEDEIGTLTDAFNSMVGTVETQQNALLQSEARLRLAMEAAAIETWVVDLGGARAGASEPADLRSFEQLLERVHADERDRVAAAIQAAVDAGASFDVEFRGATPSGEERWAEFRGQVHGGQSGQPVRLIGVTQDTTDRRRVEQQLIQSQKMEAIGNLAGGIAHDFNNLLTGIIGYLTFAQRRLPPGTPVRADIDEVERAARRAAALTSQLLSYARRQMVVPTVVDLNASVGAMEPMLRRLLGEDVEVITELDGTLWPVRVDPGQLEQVILNLAANARDAMPAGGTLRVRTRNVTLSSDDVGRQPELRPGDYAALIVADTGLGMTPEVKDRIFEPFFTTKPAGAGTGLGLAMCYGIAKQAEGHIMVESELNKGSELTVLLPRVPGELSAVADRSLAELPRGTETILVSEDDAVVRLLAVRTLSEAGYTVLEAATAAAGLELAAAHPGPIHLLLTDVVMPGGSGRDLAEALLPRWPHLRVIFMSGYTSDVVLRRGVVEESVRFLAKPFSPLALAHAVRRELDTRPSREWPTRTG
ncbi:MAG TPA: ATP-binding protein [Gemmatimonadales bacterium]|nr:ATP-binding protein [Gemmatimonadales bacterium]